MKEYKIFINNCRSYITLYVFKTKSTMHKKIDTDNKQHGDCLGMFAPSHYYMNNEGILFYQDKIGTMYLNNKNLGVGVVSHECLHAAMTCERTLNRFTMEYSQEIDENEERLCYLLTEIVKSVYDILYANKHIKDKKHGNKKT